LRRRPAADMHQRGSGPLADRGRVRGTMTTCIS
jgi:hypothetical protein